MPATTKKQQRFFGLVHLVQQGKIKAPSANIQKAADSMSEGDVNDYAKTKHNKLAALIKAEGPSFRLQGSPQSRALRLPAWDGPPSGELTEHA